MSYLILCFLVLFIPLSFTFSFFFFNDTATTEIYTLSLHDALPIFPVGRRPARRGGLRRLDQWLFLLCALQGSEARSEEHTSELQSRLHLVCRLLLEKKKKIMCTNKVYLKASRYISCRARHEGAKQS